MKIKNANGNETNEFELNDKKFERYDEAIEALNSFTNSLKNNEKFENFWVEMKKQALVKWHKNVKFSSIPKY